MRHTSGADLLMKVDTSTGVRSRAAARFNRQPGSKYRSYHGGPDGPAFSGDGKVVPLGIDGPTPSLREVYLLNEHGTLGLGEYPTRVSARPASSSGRSRRCIRRTSTTSVTLDSWPTRRAPSTAGLGRTRCWAAAPRGSTSSQERPKPATATLKPLTPDVGRENRDPVGSPEGKQFAFISKVPATDSSPATGDKLWVGSTAGGHLRKLGTVPAGADVIGWR
jgi:hypothetical protein